MSAPHSSRRTASAPKEATTSTREQGPVRVGEGRDGGRVVARPARRLGMDEADERDGTIAGERPLDRFGRHGPARLGNEADDLRPGLAQPPAEMDPVRARLQVESGHAAMAEPACRGLEGQDRLGRGEEDLEAGLEQQGEVPRRAPRGGRR